jgi:hypothetical protein
MDFFTSLVFGGLCSLFGVLTGVLISDYVKRDLKRWLRKQQ